MAERTSAKVVGGSVAALVLAAAAIIAPWEGLRTDPYKDLVGKWTVCYGETNAPMRRYTPAECKAMLEASVREYADGLLRCISRPVTVPQGAALISWAYNVGTPSACRSTLVRKLNAGAPASEWCRELLRWDYAGGKRVRGLTNRRKAEYEVCIQ
ncbi:MAG: lysozyme [Gammaproteobacteria bacterium]|nr:lysozyme [Gammaproteobacteria bacterium]